MKTLIGGAIAVLLGVIGLAVWFDPFLKLLAGVIPVMLLLGGGLALYLGFDELYLGFDELKDSWTKEEPAVTEPEDYTEKAQKEIDDLKKEIDILKSDKK